MEGRDAPGWARRQAAKRAWSMGEIVDARSVPMAMRFP
jgi:hypothetical protein